MKCFKYTIKSSDVINGRFQLNSQQSHELSNSLNDRKLYKIVISRFILSSFFIDDVNLTKTYAINIKFPNVSFCNSYDGNYTDNVVLRMVGHAETYTEGVTTYNIITANYDAGTIENNSVGMYSTDRIIENGNLEVKLTCASFDATEIGNDTYIPVWVLEFFVIFD